MDKFVALFDMHWGYERDASRHKVPLHDEKAVSVALQFIKDFKPDHIVLGGDILDCGSISHHRRGRVGQLEGLRLLAEAKECKEAVIKPLEKLVRGRLIYHVGNHEDWLRDVTDEMPALEGIVDISALLGLNDRWEVVEQGGASKLGKLTFLHGDQIKGGQNPAYAAVNAYERNVRFGHFHTFQIATKTTPIDANGHTGIAVPCLCKKGHMYGQGAPNKWMQGFLWGYTNGPEGIFNDYVTVIVNGKANVGGKLYRG
jgi:UDP-2,3-diacylglucosamine pyrophosphatase LpxH